MGLYHLDIFYIFAYGKGQFYFGYAFSLTEYWTS